VLREHAHKLLAARVQLITSIAAAAPPPEHALAHIDPCSTFLNLSLCVFQIGMQEQKWRFFEKGGGNNNKTS
jgi:hypothetical protein